MKQFEKDIFSNVCWFEEMLFQLYSAMSSPLGLETEIRLTQLVLGYLGPLYQLFGGMGVGVGIKVCQATSSMSPQASLVALNSN